MANREIAMAVHCASCGALLKGTPPPSADQVRCPRCRDAASAADQRGRFWGIAVAGAVGAVVLLTLVGGLALCLSLGGGEHSAAKEATQPPQQTEPDSSADTPLTPEPAPGNSEPKATSQEGPKQSTGRPQGRTVMFMNSVGEGRRFCIIADNSQSMKGAPLTHCKQEVLKTLRSLTTDMEFYVIFFNAQAVPMPYESWLSGEPENVEKVAPWVQSLGTVYKTLPLPAFAKALELKPRPDVIFFMTDGLMRPDTTAKVAAMNKQEPKVVINTIMFTRGRQTGAALSKLAGAERQLKTIAQQSGGTYTLYSAAK